MKKKRKSKVALYIAVVVSPDSSPCALMVSRRAPMGDWACFIGQSKEIVIDRALHAVRKWGTYDIWIGTLTEKVVVPTNFKLVKL
jgi:hypothetical protein